MPRKSKDRPPPPSPQAAKLPRVQVSATATFPVASAASVLASAKMHAVVEQVPPEVRANYEMWLEIRSETDRGAAILAAAYLEAILQDVICSFFYVNRTTAKAIFGPDGPLVSLAAKTKLAYCLGLYGKTVAQDIDTIGSIRNKFAHRKALLRFSDKNIHDLCYRISRTV